MFINHFFRNSITNFYPRFAHLDMPENIPRAVGNAAGKGVKKAGEIYDAADPVETAKRKLHDLKAGYNESAHPQVEMKSQEAQRTELIQRFAKLKSYTPTEVRNALFDAEHGSIKDSDPAKQKRHDDLLMDLMIAAASSPELSQMKITFVGMAEARDHDIDSMNARSLQNMQYTFEDMLKYDIGPGDMAGEIQKYKTLIEQFISAKDPAAYAKKFNSIFSPVGGLFDIAAAFRAGKKGQDAFYSNPRLQRLPPGVNVYRSNHMDLYLKSAIPANVYTSGMQIDYQRPAPGTKTTAPLYGTNSTAGVIAEKGQEILSSNPVPEIDSAAKRAGWKGVRQLETEKYGTKKYNIERDIDASDFDTKDIAKHQKKLTQALAAFGKDPKWKQYKPYLKDVTIYITPKNWADVNPMSEGTLTDDNGIIIDYTEDADDGLVGGGIMTDIETGLRAYISKRMQENPDTKANRLAYAKVVDMFVDNYDLLFDNKSTKPTWEDAKAVAHDPQRYAASLAANPNYVLDQRRLMQNGIQIAYAEKIKKYIDNWDLLVGHGAPLDKTGSSKADWQTTYNRMTIAGNGAGESAHFDEDPRTSSEMPKVIEWVKYIKDLTQGAQNPNIPRLKNQSLIEDAKKKLKDVLPVWKGGGSGGGSAPQEREKERTQNEFEKKTPAEQMAAINAKLDDIANRTAIRVMFMPSAFEYNYPEIWENIQHIDAALTSIQGSKDYDKYQILAKNCGIRLTPSNDYKLNPAKSSVYRDGFRTVGGEEHVFIEAKEDPSEIISDMTKGLDDYAKAHPEKILEYKKQVVEKKMAATARKYHVKFVGEKLDKPKLYDEWENVEAAFAGLGSDYLQKLTDASSKGSTFEVRVTNQSRWYPVDEGYIGGGYSYNYLMLIDAEETPTEIMDDIKDGIDGASRYPWRSI